MTEPTIHGKPVVPVESVGEPIRVRLARLTLRRQDGDNSQRPWRVRDGDGTGEYAVSSTVARAIEIAREALS